MHPYCVSCLQASGKRVYEDQEHIFVTCPYVQEERGRLLSDLEAVLPGFRGEYREMGDMEKLRQLMVAAPEGHLGQQEQTEAERRCATVAVCRFLKDALDKNRGLRTTWRRHFTKEG